MSTEILTPFGLDQSGSISITTDPNVQTNQHVETLVSTEPGERVMLPEYGIDTFGKVFAADDEIVDTELINAVTSQMAAWEPNVNVIAIKSVPMAGYPTGFATVEVDWSPVAVQIPNSIGVVTATVLVGGTIVENSVSG